MFFREGIAPQAFKGALRVARMLRSSGPGGKFQASSQLFVHILPQVGTILSGYASLVEIA